MKRLVAMILCACVALGGMTVLSACEEVDPNAEQKKLHGEIAALAEDWLAWDGSLTYVGDISDWVAHDDERTEETEHTASSFDATTGEWVTVSTDAEQNLTSWQVCKALSDGTYAEYHDDESDDVLTDAAYIEQKLVTPLKRELIPFAGMTYGEFFAQQKDEYDSMFKGAPWADSGKSTFTLRYEAVDGGYKLTYSCHYYGDESGINDYTTGYEIVVFADKIDITVGMCYIHDSGTEREEEGNQIVGTLTRTYDDSLVSRIDLSDRPMPTKKEQHRIFIYRDRYDVNGRWADWGTDLYTYFEGLYVQAMENTTLGTELFWDKECTKPVAVGETSLSYDDTMVFLRSTPAAGYAIVSERFFSGSKKQTLDEVLNDYYNSWAKVTVMEAGTTYTVKSDQGSTIFVNGKAVSAGDVITIEDGGYYEIDYVQLCKV